MSASPVEEDETAIIPNRKNLETLDLFLQLRPLDSKKVCGERGSSSVKTLMLQCLPLLLLDALHLMFMHRRRNETGKLFAGGHHPCTSHWRPNCIRNGANLNKNNTFIAAFRDWNMLQDIRRISRRKLA